MIKRLNIIGPVVLTSLLGLMGCQDTSMLSVEEMDKSLLAEIGESLPNYKIAFASPRDSGSDQDIWIVNTDGSNERNLTESLSGGFDIYPEWGPEGKFVYFTSTKHKGEAIELFRVNTTGEPKPEQISNFGKEVRSLSVSPDNGYIALGIMSAAVPLGSDLKPYSADLFVLDQKRMNSILSSGKLVTLDDLTLVLSEPTDEHIWHEQPDWEPGLADSESRIAYVRTQNYDNDPIMVDELWTVNMDGSNNTRLSESGSMPRWTSDRSQIVTHEFMAIDPTSGKKKALLVSNLAGDAGAASMSPDGKYLLFETNDRGRQAGVARIVYKGASTQENPFSLLMMRPAYEPRWSPVPVQ